MAVTDAAVARVRMAIAGVSSFSQVSPSPANGLQAPRIYNANSVIDDDSNPDSADLHIDFQDF